jgi:hypothetical protein
VLVYVGAELSEDKPAEEAVSVRGMGLTLLSEGSNSTSLSTPSGLRLKGKDGMVVMKCPHET